MRMVLKDRITESWVSEAGGRAREASEKNLATSQKQGLSDG